ncbi:MAG: hypothetical protein ACP5FK_11900 [bacterium]
MQSGSTARLFDRKAIYPLMYTNPSTIPRKDTNYTNPNLPHRGE